MEEEMKNTGAFNENAEEMQQQETPDTAPVAEDTAEQPKQKRSYKWVILFFVFVAAISVTMLLVSKARRDKETYAYEYGEEPDEGPVSYSNGKSNIINPVTKKVIVKDIDWCHYSDETDEDPIVLFAKNGKRGFCNTVTDEVIVEPTTYTKAWIFSEGLAAVERNGYIGFVNTSGKVAIGFRFSYRGNPLTEFVFHNGHCVVADSSNKLGVIDLRGRWVIKPLYDKVELARDYAIVYKDGDFKKQIAFNGEIMQDGIIDYINNLYYDVSYTDLQTGEQKLGQAKNNDFYEYRVGGYSGLLNGNGEVITPPIYTDITGITPTLFKAQLQDWNSLVIIDQKGNVLSKVAK